MENGRRTFFTKPHCGVNVAIGVQRPPIGTLGVRKSAKKLKSFYLIAFLSQVMYARAQIYTQPSILCGYADALVIFVAH